MAYVIRRTDQGGGYLADPKRNRGRCWTRDVANARRFATREAASRECCPENERPLSLDDLLQPVEGN